MPRTLEAEARDFVGELQAADYAHPKTSFDEKMTSALPPALLGKLWQGLAAQGGKLASVGEVRTERKDAFEIVTLKLAFERANVALHVVFDDQHRVAGLFHDAGAPWSPPPYAVAARFEEREVTVGLHALPGTLTLPKGAGKWPVVVLVHGSGPNDRDETVGGVKPFKALAWGLASKGIAVLRYVKRTRHAPAGVVTSKDEVEDAAHEALALVRTLPEIDPARVFLLGHSQGGQMAPRIAAGEPKLAGVVLMAGAARPLEDMVIEQLEYIERTMHPGDRDLGAQIAAAKAFKAKVESPALEPDEDVAFPVGRATLKGAYFLDLRRYDPPAVAAKLGMPLLVLQGGRDYQVTGKDLERWKAALGTRATYRTYAPLNHLFVAGEGTPGPAEYALPGHVAAAVVDDIAAFVSGSRASAPGS